MKKRLNVDSIRNELEGSVFFSQKKETITPPPVPAQQLQPQPELEAVTPSVQKLFPEDKGVKYTDDTVRASKQASMHASTLASNMDLETIRKTLKLVGKEVLYIRLTPEEKKQIDNIEHTYYHNQGIRTSGNEIGRIGINFLLEDYKVNGENSILAKLLVALHT